MMGSKKRLGLIRNLRERLGRRRQWWWYWSSLRALVVGAVEGRMKDGRNRRARQQASTATPDLPVVPSLNTQKLSFLPTKFIHCLILQAVDTTLHIQSSLERHKLVKRNWSNTRSSKSCSLAFLSLGRGRESRRNRNAAGIMPTSMWICCIAMRMAVPIILVTYRNWYDRSFVG